MRMSFCLLLLLLGGCASQLPQAVPPPLTESVAQPAMPDQLPGRKQMAFDLTKPESYLEREIYRAFGEEPLEAARAAQSSILLRWGVGLPNPENPAGNTALQAGALTSRGWMVWKGGAPEMLPPGVGQSLSRILAGPELWQEPGSAQPNITCTDAGGLEIVIRHRGRLRTNRLSLCDARWKTNAQLGLTLLREKVNPAY